MPAEGIFDGEYPEELDALWRLYRDLRSVVPRDPMSGKLVPIPESELGWYMQNKRIRLSVCEQQALRLLDVAYRKPDIDLFPEQE